MRFELHQRFFECQLCGDEKPLSAFPRFRQGRVYRRCKACLDMFPVDRIFLRDRGICGICGVRVPNLSAANIDHVIPISRGGQHTEENVQLAHRTCNREKGDRIL